MMVILLWTLSLTGLCMLANGFNIDVVHPLVFTDPMRVPQSKSYFGYKVQFLLTQEGISEPQELWILVGAPRANATHPDDIRDNATEPGRLYRCGVKLGKGGCEEFVVDGNMGCCDTQQGKRPYPIKDSKDFSWLGGAMAVQSPNASRIAVCGHLGKNFIHKSKQSVKVTGVCHFSNNTRNLTKNFVKIVPLDNIERGVITHAIPNVTSFYYQYGLAGFDIHFSSPSQGPQELIIGAPGVFKWTGTVIRYRDSRTVKVSSNRARIFNKYDDGYDFSDDMVPDPRKTSWLQRRSDNYFGYTVFSGKFSSSNTISYVASAPRGSNMTGRVMIFDFGQDENSSLVDKVELVGSQVGEYFGASLLALDINKDGFDDLLVGAPLYSSAVTKTSDEGRVYVYINNQGTLKKQDTDLSGSRASFARFGTTIASAGDMNQDGYEDVLVGAPYENDNKGAVYLYHGSHSGINPKFAQRIGAQDFEPASSLVFKGFGIHMTKFYSDFNTYPYVLVGSYLSGHAVLFRSQPIVSFQLNLTAMPNQVTNNNEPVKIRACVSYSAPQSTLVELCAAVKLQLDVKYTYGSRLRFVDRKYGSHIATYKQILSSNKANCMDIETEFHQSKVDNSRPIYIQLSVEILDSSRRPTGELRCSKVVYNAPGSKAVFMEARQSTDTFCTTCPVLDKTESNAMEISIPFANSCGNKACVADLELTTSFVGVPNDTDFVLGSQKSIGIDARVENHGEPASETAVSFYLPPAVSLVRLPVGCIQPPGKVECFLGSGTLRSGEPEHVRISLDLSNVGIDTQLLEFRSEVSTKSDLRNSTFPRFTNMSINLHIIADVTIIGSGVRELQPYQRPNETFPGSDLVPFSHRYEFVKYQASSLDLVRLEFEFPINLTVNGVVVPIAELYSATALQDNKPLSCKGAFTAHKYEAESEALTEKDQEDNNNEINRRSRRDVKSHKSRPRRGHDYPEALAIAAQHNLSFSNKIAPVPANRTSFFNCSMPDVQCGKVVCDAGSIDNSTRISVVLNAAVNIQSLLPYLEKRETIMITSMGFVTILKPGNARQPTNHKPDNATASTWFNPTSSQAEDYIPLWILIASGIGGLLILLFIGLILAQCGFFKRKKFDKVEEQSPDEAETTQSHQTQEEDASKEFEIEEYYEQ